MTLTHQAFLLEADAFKARIAPLLEALDANSARPLYEEAKQIVQSVSDDWILSAIDGNLLDISKMNFVGIPYDEPIELLLDSPSRIKPADLGYWFLIIFSTYLRKYDGIGMDYELLEWLLVKLGWASSDASLLINGAPVAQLLSSNVDPHHIKLTNSDPYWYWMRPAYSSKSGWLSRQQISDLYDKLLRDKQAVHTFNPEWFGQKWNMVSLSIPNGQIDLLHRAQAAYQAAIHMLDFAKSKDKELYTVIFDT